MRSRFSHLLVSLFIAALMAFTISISAVAANDVAVSMGAPVAFASMVQDNGCRPTQQMPSCDKAILCELVCLTSAFTMPSDPVSLSEIARPGQALAQSNDLLMGIASPLERSPPRLTYIA
jgi:O-antigen ligase